MRVALVSQSFLLDGSIPRAHVELTRYLVDAGHEVHVFSAAGAIDASLAPGAHFHPVAAVAYGRSRLREAAACWSFARQAQHAVDRAGPFEIVHSRGPAYIRADIVYLTGVMSGETRRYRQARGRVGIVRRNKDALSPVVRPLGPVRSRLERRALAAATEIHVDSDQVLDDLLAVRHPAKPITVVTPGINVREFASAADKDEVRRSLGLPSDSTIVLFCANAFWHKGFDRLLAAHARMREPALLVAVGRADAVYPKSDRVLYAGLRNDVARFYQAADVFALPARIDLWGSTVLEAMASGLPTIVSSAAGSSKAVVHGETGFVLPEPVDVDALAHALDLLVTRPDLRERLGTAARGAARAYGWDRHGRAVEASMTAVVAARRAGGRESTASG